MCFFYEGNDENLLKLNLVTVAQTCEYSKTTELYILNEKITWHELNFIIL